MKKTILFLSTLLIVFTANAQFAPAFTARLQTVFDSVCNRYRIRGATTAVHIPGVGTWTSTYGISQVGQPMNSNMLLGIGSNTKTYIATLMLLLEQQGLLSIDDTIGNWFPNQTNISGAIKIRQLLNHTSGLFDYTQHPNFQDSLFNDVARTWQPEQMLQLVDTPNFAAGTRHDYSNTNYLLAGIIIKHVTNMQLGMALRQYLFTPQGLNKSILFPEDVPMADIAHPWSYIASGSYQEDLFATYGYSNNGMFSMAYSAGAIMTTAEDNALFWHKLNAGHILNASSMNKLHTYVPVSAGSSVGYGLGIFRYPNFLNGHTAYTHGGTNIGYINENAVDSVTGTAITVLTNQDSIGNDRLLAGVVRALLKATLQLPATNVSQVSGNIADMHFYPNPAHDMVNIDNANSIKGSLELRDMSGKVFKTADLKDGRNTFYLNEVPAGIYQMSISGKDGKNNYSQKIVVL